MSQRPALPPPLRRALREVPATLRLAVPIVVGLSAATLIGVVDTIMIAPLGTEEMAATSLAVGALVILYSALYGLVSVIGVAMARAAGEGRPERVAAQLRSGAMLALGVGALAGAGMAAAFPLLAHLGQPPEVLAVLRPYWMAVAAIPVPFTLLYLIKNLYDAVGRPWTGAGFALLGAAVNVPLNWALIHGIGGWPGLGLLGAGIASVLAECAALLAAWAHWRTRPSMAPWRAPAPASRRLALAQLREGAPLAVAYAGEGMSWSIAGLMMGWFGTAALAASQIVNSVASVIYMLPLGMAAAVGLRVGAAIGAGRARRVRAIGAGAILAVTGWMALMTGAIVVLRRPVAGALSDDPAVVATAAAMFLTVAAMQVADGVQSTALGALRGMSDTAVPSGITLLAYWPVALPAAWAVGFPLGLGPPGVWIGYGAGLGLAAAALTARFLALSRVRPAGRAA